MTHWIALILSCAFISISLIAPAIAQEAYTPPDMFGDTSASTPTKPEVPNTQTPAPTMPASEALLGEENAPTPPPKADSRPQIALPEQERPKPILEATPKLPKPVPPAKNLPETVTKKAAPIPPASKPKIEKEAVKKEAEKETKTVTKKTGPKMPAIPARPVEQEILPEIAAQPTQTNVDSVTKIQDKALEQKMVTPSAEALLDQIEGTPSPKKDFFTNEKSIPIKDDVLSALPDTSKNNANVSLEKVTLRFKPNLSDISTELNGILSSDVLPKLQANKSARVQLQAYASASEDDGQSSARRISLSRALSVRGWLIDKGIDAARMDVRALGMNTNQEPVDRVDLVFVNSP